MNKRNAVVLYTSAVCNLNCVYCGIDKNPALKMVDDLIEDSFLDEDYYFNFIKEYLPNRAQLERLETWGGEPFLRMDRIYPTLHKLIDYYPYFSNMYSSTNFSYPEWTTQVFGLFKQFGKYPERRFSFTLQLSCDGPEYINDSGRGKGTTLKCINNFNKFILLMGDNIPPNLTVNMTLKPTLSVSTMELLNTKEKIIEYYKFFEDTFITAVRTKNYDNVTIGLPIPNIAVPAQATSRDGKLFAEMCKLCREIEAENSVKHYFKYYTRITMFPEIAHQESITYQYPYNTCGTGCNVIGFLPNRMLSGCHEGFVNMAVEYKKYAEANTGKKLIEVHDFIKNQKAKFCMNESGYVEYERQLSFYNESGTSARLANITALISLQALFGQIDKKYQNDVEAVKAAVFLQSHMSYCVKDNFNTTGSVTLIPVGMIRLFFNGASEYIQEVTCS